MPPQPAKTRLGRYRILAPRCGLRVSPFMLGCMSIGQADAARMGSMTKEDSFKLLDAYYAAGGNCLDTSNGYQAGESETWIGEWMQARKNRDQMVVITKYTSNWQRASDEPIQVNYAGNSYKSMIVSVEASLKKLQTSYIDLLYIHWWDWTTDIPEVMNGLNNLVKQGKVLYLGASDTPAWIISRANEYARQNGLSQFVVFQGRWSAQSREVERDIVPMCTMEGMGIAPWGAIGMGRFQRAADFGKSKDGRSAVPLSEDEKKVSAALEKVADELGIQSVTAVALAWIMSKYAYVYPIIGGRKVEHLHDNLQALELHLSPEQVNSIDHALPFSYGDCLEAFGLDPHMTGFQGSPVVAAAGMVDYVPLRAPIDMTKVRASDTEAAAAWKN